MWGWGGVVCCHLLDFNHIHIVFLCVCVAQTTFIIYTQTGNLGRAPHGRLAHHARHPSPAFEEGEGRPWRSAGSGVNMLLPSASHVTLGSWASVS